MAVPVLAGDDATSARESAPSSVVNVTTLPPIDPSDQGATHLLIEDVELPSKVTERARDLLGDRYVDTSINHRHSAYVVGVLHLKASEVADLESALSGPAPVRVETRAVTAESVDAWRRLVESAVLNTRGKISTVGSSAGTGSVYVGVQRARSLGDVAKLVEQAIPGEQRIVPRDDGLNVVSPSPGDPVVQVRVVTLSDLS